MLFKHRVCESLVPVYCSSSFQRDRTSNWHLSARPVWWRGAPHCAQGCSLASKRDPAFVMEIDLLSQGSSDWLVLDFKAALVCRRKGVPGIRSARLSQNSTCKASFGLTRSMCGCGIPLVRVSSTQLGSHRFVAAPPQNRLF